MKASMSVRYPTRSLVRGGQRTLLAIFCIAVGVMAIVSLQLVGLMLNEALTTNVRDANGGDIAVSAPNQPLNNKDLTYFKQLQQKHTINRYTPIINVQGTIMLSNKQHQSFTLRVVEPNNYPLVTPPAVLSPAGKMLGNLLNKGVIATPTFMQQYHKKIGDSLDIHAISRNQNGRTIHTTIVGTIAETGVLAQTGSLLLLSTHIYQTAAPKEPLLYDTVDITTAGQAQTEQAVKAIQNHFPAVTTVTAQQALKARQASVDSIRKFLEIAGLLALLIGGVGIVNTMQVLLSRRRTEIAMLKTTGYRRFDLMLLFALETGLLGLIGGTLGAATATGVSYIIRALVERAFGLSIPFRLDAVTIAGGILIGLLTALIFGLMPIAQAATLRPIHVLRNPTEGRVTSSPGITLSMLFLLSILFCGLAIFILNKDIRLGIIVVYGTFLFLGLLSLLFALVVLLMSVLPVPERFTIGYFALILVGLFISGLLYLLLPAFGGLLLVVTLLGLLMVVLPRNWKLNIRMALRNLDRQRARTTTTMLALFVGIFTIGLILVLGQDLRDNINNALARSMNYNVMAVTSNKDTTTLRNKLKTIPGLSTYQEYALVATMPLAVNGKPILSQLPATASSTSNKPTLGRLSTFYFLGGIVGYDVAKHQLPDINYIEIVNGRNLDANDANANNVLIPIQLATIGPLHLKVGDTLTLSDLARQHEETVKVVGVYQPLQGANNIYPLLGTDHAINGLQPAGTGQAVFYMKINPKQASKAVNIISNMVPNAFVMNLANIGDVINQMLSNTLLTLTALASLSLLAGIIIIANAVALAMLERRRELGILKSVGYTSGSILSGVMLENALVGGTGALLAMLLVTFVTNLLGRFVFRSSFGVSSPLALTLILGAAALAMLIALLVASGTVRVRPLEVLRYE